MFHMMSISVSLKLRKSIFCAVQLCCKCRWYGIITFKGNKKEK